MLERLSCRFYATYLPMKKHTLCLLFVLIGILFTTEVFAQRRISQYQGRRTPFAKNKKYFSVGANINALNYFGDLAPKSHIASTKLTFTRPGFGVTGMYRIGPESSIRGGFMWGRLKGDDFSADPLGQNSRYRYMRNLHFRNDIKEFSFEYVFDLFSHNRTFITRPKTVPYLFAGLAIFHHNPRAKVPEVDVVHYNVLDQTSIQRNDSRYNDVSPGDWIPLKPLGTEGQYVEGSGVKPYSNWQIAIPFGAGVRYKLSRYFDLSFELSYRQTFTDYIDDVSGHYINLDEFPNTPEGNLSRLVSDRSKEPIAAVVEDARNLEVAYSNNFHYYGQKPAEFGGGEYQVIRGFGSEHRDNIRGKEDFDVYLVTKIQVTYIIGTNIRNAKFR